VGVVCLRVRLRAREGDWESGWDLRIILEESACFERVRVILSVRASVCESCQCVSVISMKIGRQCFSNILRSVGNERGAALRAMWGCQ
jgi:hypothetical protein